MFFSAEYGIKRGEVVEPRFFNTECSVAVLVKHIKDKVVKDVSHEIHSRMKEEQKQLLILQQLTKAEGEVTRLIDAEVKQREEAFKKLSEAEAKLDTLMGIDLSYSPDVTGRLNLDKSSSAPAYTVLAMRSRTYVIGELPDSQCYLSFDIPAINRAEQVSSLLASNSA